ncbi:flagellar export chaperone FliS [Alkaliphilus peptidifermentans]|uniref:Flagellar protein FliS n=1 Tax=Alkaliphilus peptidifermentans DSM 18978 TaxID=1120976 RepID=A0A1G5IEM0_9FIRM|nr:flagellar export chaperone FliS [Alkaliphilus peptidifermentans]SCY74407.1 flagellar protein FliS [Alkaliphilus peptidifermentans DSM 18978]
MLDKEYITNRITTANDLQLVELLYEGLMEYIEEGKTALNNKNEIDFNYNMTKVRDILAELFATLQGDSEITNNLRSIYLFINRLITAGAIHKDPVRLDEALKVVSPLFDAWQQLSSEELGHQQGPAVVTGYTYGKGQLNDYVVKEEKWEKA